MRLKTFTDYSLRVLLYVATAPERRATIAEIARAFDISENHLVKVVHGLGKLRLLANTRGRGGGLRLAHEPAAMNLGRIVRAIEHADVVECFDADHNTCAIAGRCGLERVLHEAIDAFYEVLGRYTLEDLIARRRPVHALVAMPPRHAAPGR